MTEVKNKLVTAEELKLVNDRVKPVTEGGTGGNTPASARQNLGITPTNIGAVATDAIIDVSHGGTNGTTTAQARTNLNVYSKSESDTKYSNTINIGTYTSWGDVYERLYVLPNERVVPCIINASTISMITNNQLSANMLGFVAWVSNRSSLTFVGTSLGGNYIHTFRLTNVTSESYTLGTIYRFDGTVVA